MNDVFLAELHGKWLARADALTDQQRETNRHLADIAQSLARIAGELEAFNKAVIRGEHVEVFATTHGS